MPLVPLTAAWLFGLLGAVLWPGADPTRAGIAAGGAAVCAAVLPLLWSDRRARWVGLLAVAAWLGLARGLAAAPPLVPPPDSLRAWNVPAATARSAAAPVTRVRAHLLTDPEPARGGRATQVRLAAEAVWADGTWRPVHGGLLAVTAPWLDLGTGDTVEVAGVVQDPPGVSGFDYAGWLARHGFESYVDQPRVTRLAPAAAAPDTLLATWRREAGLRVAALLPEPEAGLLRGAVLGQQKAADAAMRADFAATGASWVLVVSGMHLSLLLACLYLPLRRVLAAWPSVMIAVALAAAYAAFVGLGVPVMRAALMAALVLLAQALGRPATSLNLLAVAALMLTLGDPNVVADAGFQLSFGAVAGILWLAPPLMRRWRRVPVLGELAAVAIAVQLTTWPIVAWQFGQIIPIAVPAGIACGLLLPPILLLGAAQVSAAALWLPLGQMIAWVAWLPLALLAGVLHIAAGLPGAAFALPGPAAPVLLGWYALLGGLWVVIRRRRVAAMATAPL